MLVFQLDVLAGFLYSGSSAGLVPLQGVKFSCVLPPTKLIIVRLKLGPLRLTITIPPDIAPGPVSCHLKIDL